MPKLPTLTDVYQARKRIRSLIWKTPLVPSPELAKLTQALALFRGQGGIRAEKRNQVALTKRNVVLTIHVFSHATLGSTL